MICFDTSQGNGTSLNMTICGQYVHGSELSSYICWDEAPDTNFVTNFRNLYSDWNQQSPQNTTIHRIQNSTNISFSRTLHSIEPCTIQTNVLYRNCTQQSNVPNRTLQSRKHLISKNTALDGNCTNTIFKTKLFLCKITCI